MDRAIQPLNNRGLEVAFLRELSFPVKDGVIDIVRQRKQNALGTGSDKISRILSW